MDAAFADLADVTASLQELDARIGESGHKTIETTLKGATLRRKKSLTDDALAAPIALDEPEEVDMRAVGEEAMAVRDSDGRRKRCVVVGDKGLGLYRVRFDNGEEQDVYTTHLGRMAASERAEDLAVENTEVSATQDPATGAMTVTTTYTIRDTRSNTVYVEAKTETAPPPSWNVAKSKLQQQRARISAHRLSGVPAAAAVPAAEAKPAPKEFSHCMAELIQTEKDFATRLEAVVVHYEAPLMDAQLINAAAMTVVFGNSTLSKLVEASRACVKAVEECGADVRGQFAAWWDYYNGARGLYFDQIVSRAVGQLPLQGMMQSNRKLRRFCESKVEPCEKWFLARSIQTHGHLGSVLYAPVQRLPRVLLLVDRMKKVWPEAPGADDLAVLVQELLTEFEKGK